MTPFDAKRDRPLRVLFVEDSEDDLVLILRHLRKHGIDPDHRRVESRSGLVEALEEREWDLILADYTLPRLSAPKALEVMKETGRDVPFLVVSGTIGEERAVELMRAGAHDFLLKDQLHRLVPAIVRELQDARERSRRRKAEEEVRSANARLRRLLSDSPVVIYSARLSGDLTTTYISENVEERFGHPARAFLDEADFWREHIHPDDRERVHRAFAPGNIRNGGEIDYRFRHGDGSYRWVRDGFEVVRGENGAPEEIVGYFLDITEEKEAQQRLRKSEERFRQIAAHIDEVFWISSPEKDEMEYVSPAYADIWGRTPEELYDDPTAWFEQIHPDDRERIQAALSTQASGAYDEEYRIVRPDGQVRWVRDRAFPIRDADGDVYRIVGVAQDVTERRNARDELRQAEAHYRALIENSADVIALLDDDLVTRYASPAVVDLLGYTPEEIAGSSGEPRVHPDDRERVMESLRRLREKPGETLLHSYRMITSDGEIRHVEARVHNLLDEPAVEGLVVNLRDITQQKELEEQLLQSQKLEAVGRLAGGVAHDFNNILTVVEGHADLLLEDLPAGSRPREDAEEIQRASRRAAALTQQLLAFARKQVLEPRTVDLSDSARGIVKMLKRVLGEDVEIFLDLAEEPLPIHVDPVQIDQVILNLALNAREAMPEGGRLTLRTRQEASVPSATGRDEPPTPCVLQVEDTGEGIPEELRDQIFDPFFTTRDEGSGLGLSTVYGIVEQSGGSIDVESETGEGTRFTIRFVRAEAEEAPGPELPSRAGGDGGQKEPKETRTVLVVEDDDGLRPLLRRILEREAYRVITAATPDEALEVLERETNGVELVVTDLVLPGMRGTDFVRRAREADPELRTLVISGYTDEDVPWEDLPEDARSFLAKPFAADQLLKKVEELLGRK